MQPPPIVAGACYVHVKAQAGAAAGLVERVSHMHDVAGVAVLGGEWDLLICVAQPWEVASGLVLDEIHQLPGVVETSTLVAIAYEEPDDDRDQFSAWINDLAGVGQREIAHADGQRESHALFGERHDLDVVEPVRCEEREHPVHEPLGRRRS